MSAPRVGRSRSGNVKSVIPTPEGVADNELRVFVSSTFEDLGEARDLLVRRVFPRVRAHCEAQGIAFADIDLRWGVTEEAVDRDMLIEYCLAEIERCNCFVGLLGDRYGTVVDAIPRLTIERYPWLANHAGESVTELEFYAGILGPSPSAQHCVVCRLASASGGATDSRQARVLEAVRAAGLPLEENLDLDRLEQVLSERLCAIADVVAGARGDDADTAPVRHGQFALRRAGFLHGYDEALARLDAYLEDGGPPLAVTGVPGIGKTALLTAWRRRLSPVAGRDLFVFHFADVDRVRGGLSALLDHLLEAARTQGLIEEEVAPERREIPLAIPDWLYALSEHVRLLLVVDGVDLLDNGDGARELLWLPAELPESLRVVVSFRPGLTTKAAVERGFGVVPLDGLPAPERVSHARAFLAHFGKTLGDAEAAQIGGSEACGVPAFLVTVLGELRLYANHRGVPNELAWYLESGSLEALYGRLLSRLERDRQVGPPGLLARALALLLAARDGLLEVELLDLLGDAESPLPASAWVPLRQRLAALVSTEGGFLAPTSVLARAMIDRHFELALTRTAVHERLTEYFAGRLESPRGRREAPWHTRRAGQWTRLAHLWQRPEVLAAAAEAGELEQAIHDWREIEQRTGESAAAAYAPIVAAPWQTPEHAELVADVLVGLERYDEAHELLLWLARSARFVSRDPTIHVWASVRLAWVRVRRGNFVGAVTAAAEASAAARIAGDRRLEALALAETARRFAEFGAPEQAIPMFRDAGEIFRELGAHFHRASCLSDLGIALESSDNPADALDAYTEAERLFARSGSARWLARARSHQATAHWLLGDRREALHLWNDVAVMFRMLGDESGLAVALSNCGGSLAVSTGDASVVRPMLDEAEALFERLQDLDGLTRVAYARLAVSVHQGVLALGDVDRLITLRRRAGSLATLRDQLLALRALAPDDGAGIEGQLQRALSLIDGRTASSAVPERGRSREGVIVTVGEDPFVGLSTQQLLERLDAQNALTGEANSAERFEDALTHADVCMAIVEALEKYRPGQVTEWRLRMDAFASHFNLMLILFKLGRVERGLLEAAGAARRYAAFVAVASAAEEAARSSTLGLAEILPDILEQFVQLSHPDEKLGAYRARASALEVLAEAQPGVFLGRFGVALRGLSVCAYEAGLSQKAAGAVMASVETLQLAVELQGDEYLRELGFSMRFAIDSLGRDDLHEAYDEVVKREVQTISRLRGKNSR